MLLDKNAFWQFSVREKKQAEHLRKALMGRHQKIYGSPEEEVRRLSCGRRFDLLAPNPYARLRWMRTLGGYFCDAVGATAPDYVPQVPVYHFTILDLRQCISVCKSPEHIEWEWDFYYEESAERKAMGRRPPPEPKQDPSVQEMHAAYQSLVAPLKNCIGMIEPAFYVYSARELGWPYVAHYHAHVLAWGASEQQMKRAAEKISDGIEAILPYAQAVVCRRVADADLLQMIWYMCKSPRKQHQLYRRRHSLKQFKGAINGVNSVRLYSSMRDIQLPHLAVASGQGVELLNRTVEDIDAWVASNGQSR